MKIRITLMAGAALLALAPALFVPETAHANVGGPGITCSGGSSCMLQLENEVHFGGDYSPGSDNAGISVTPPCYWTPLGNAHVGSEEIVATLADSLQYAQLGAQYQAIYEQAYKMQNENPMPAGEWYMLLDTADTPADTKICSAQVGFEFVPPGTATPVVPLTPQDLAQLAIAVLKIPTDGEVTTSPKSDTTYSNLPTFMEVRLAGQFHPANESTRPYVEVVAQLDGQGATAWASASNVALNVTGAGYTKFSNCNWLGSQELVSDPGTVAGMGIGGTPDCGVTFKEPQQASITASVTWRVCYVEQAEALYGPPAPNCRFFTTLGPTTWAKDFNVEEIQAGNG
jgi:hypothetical protein